MTKFGVFLPVSGRAASRKTLMQAAHQAERAGRIVVRGEVAGWIHAQLGAVPQGLGDFENSWIAAHKKQALNAER